MNVSPAKHSYAWLLRKRDYRTDTRTDRQTPDKVIPMCRYASQAKPDFFFIQSILFISKKRVRKLSIFWQTKGFSIFVRAGWFLSSLEILKSKITFFPGKCYQDDWDGIAAAQEVSDRWFITGVSLYTYNNRRFQARVIHYTSIMAIHNNWTLLKIDSHV